MKRKKNNKEEKEQIQVGVVMFILLVSMGLWLILDLTERPTPSRKSHLGIMR